MKIQSDTGIPMGSDYKQLHQGQHFQSQTALNCPVIGCGFFVYSVLPDFYPNVV